MSGHYRRPETEQACRWRKELPANITTMRATEARWSPASLKTRPGDRPTTPTWTSRLPTWPINNRPCHVPDLRYRGWFRARPTSSCSSRRPFRGLWHCLVMWSSSESSAHAAWPACCSRSFVMELLTNRRFTLRTSDGQVSRFRRIHNGDLPGSTLAPTLFNIYISDIPKTASKQYGYADDFALIAAHHTWEKVEETLN